MNGSSNANQENGIVSVCRIWLQLIAFLHIIGGLSLSFNWPDFVWGTYQQQLLKLFSIDSISNVQINSLVTMLIQLFGPTIASWGTLMFYLARQINIDDLHSVETKKTIDILLVATSIWFVFDTTISLKFGATIHVLINSFAVMSILLPLVYLRFKKGV